MKSSPILSVVLTIAQVASSYPDMANTLAEIEKRKANRSTSLIGDLEFLADRDLTKTGSLIKNILIGKGDPQDLSSAYSSLPAKDSEACKKDPCCIWKYIADDMRGAMVEGKECNAIARGAIRLGFHDAGSWSKKTGKTGGADGSILLANECEDRTENEGLRGFCPQMRKWFDKYKSYGVSMADLIQFGATVGTVVCPVGPRIRTFVGRKDNKEAAPRGNLPGAFDDADTLIKLFEDKTISPAGLVALLGAHTVSRQRTAFPERLEAPQDSTPGTWDTRYFRETIDSNSPKEVLKLDSDVNIATDSRTKALWKSYGQFLFGQMTWNQACLLQPLDDYAREYIRMSLLGVYNINDLTECTKALPKFTGN
ncbi:peroxidase [Pochonia chlamydosporia 170]|uniref:Peroxidase n=1 Tax=Pochonia chlamydosporia 170 TaxID=1380566 RepID=A0A179FU20_METCM|nr:peroxidase [Pochonia chlamydosporia 170]OAQ68857.2 peroxidase [Pochonia chlamydosporia 170]